MQNEFVVLITMIGTFLLATFLIKLPVSLSMIIGAVCGALAGGEGIPLRHLFEGTFVYIDTMLIISTAMIFMKIIERSGALKALNTAVIKRFHKIPAVMLVLLMFMIMFPGMITGSSTAAVLSAGAIVAPILMLMDIPSEKVGAIVAIGAILGMAAPPVNIPAMLISGGVDMPYIGFEAPLLFIIIPCAVFSVLFIGIKHTNNLDYETVKAQLDFETAKKYGFKIYLPILMLILLMVLTRLFPAFIPDLGMPLIFLISAFVGIFTGDKFNVLKTIDSAVKTTIPVLSKLVGVGMFIQIMTLTGARGIIVINCLGLGTALLYLAIIIIIPAFGAVSSYGAASVLGVPFLLALISGNQIITAAALSVIVCTGDLMPPTALSGNYAAQIAGVKYSKVLRHCIIPFAVIVLYALACLIFSKNLGFLV